MHHTIIPVFHELQITSTYEVFYFIHDKHKFVECLCLQKIYHVILFSLTSLYII